MYQEPGPLYDPPCWSVATGPQEHEHHSGVDPRHRFLLFCKFLINSALKNLITNADEESPI